MTRLNSWCVFLSVGLIILLMAGAINASDGGAGHVPPHDLQQRGKALRVFLHETYQSLLAAHKLSGTSTDISDLVLPYFPTGTSFQDAEVILRNAGFHVEYPDLDPQKSNLNKPKDWYGVLASTLLVERFPFQINAYILLLPKSPGEYTDIARLRVTLFVAGP